MSRSESKPSPRREVVAPRKRLTAPRKSRTSKPAETPEEDAVSEPVVEGPAPLPPGDAKQYVGLLGEGDPTYIPNPSKTRERQIQIGSQLYEHVGEDTHGIWLYRAI